MGRLDRRYRGIMRNNSAVWTRFNNQAQKAVQKIAKTIRAVKPAAFQIARQTSVHEKAAHRKRAHTQRTPAGRAKGCRPICKSRGGSLKPTSVSPSTSVRGA